jgi:hypothetical protein
MLTAARQACDVPKEHSCGLVGCQRLSGHRRQAGRGERQRGGDEVLNADNLEIGAWT